MYVCIQGTRVYVRIYVERGMRLPGQAVRSQAWGCAETERTLNGKEQLGEKQGVTHPLLQNKHEL